jgi:hypothetical protein
VSEAGSVAAGATEAGAVAAAPGDVVAAPAAEALKSPLATATVDAPAEAAVEQKTEGADKVPAADEKKPEAETDEAKTARETAEKAERVAAFEKLTLPEGMPADQPAVADFKAAALDLGLDAAAAQKLIDTVAPKLQEAVNAPYKAWADTVENWTGQIKADPEIGGKDLQKNMGFAAAYVDSLGAADAKAFREMLDVTGAGYHPAMARLLVREGKRIAEGGPVLGGRAARATQPTAADLYPSMKQA